MTQDIIETGRRIAESYNRKGEGFDNTGKKNAYVCPDCGAGVVTIDRHFGEHDLNEDCDDA